MHFPRDITQMWAGTNLLFSTTCNAQITFLLHVLARSLSPSLSVSQSLSLSVCLSVSLSLSLSLSLSFSLYLYISLSLSLSLSLYIYVCVLLEAKHMHANHILSDGLKDKLRSMLMWKDSEYVRSLN